MGSWGVWLKSGNPRLSVSIGKPGSLKLETRILKSTPRCSRIAVYLGDVL